MHYTGIKKQREEKVSTLLTECSVFFAFSNEQFADNKTPLEEGDVYISMGAGGYLPKSKQEALEKGFVDIDVWFRAEIALHKQEDNEILYELNNHECFYTGDVEDALPVLEPNYSLEKILEVFHNNQGG